MLWVSENDTVYDCGALTFIAVASFRGLPGQLVAFAVMLEWVCWHIAEFGGGIGTGDFQ